MALTPADKLVVDFDRLACSDHVESSELVWYFVAPGGAFHDQVIESASAMQDTDSSVLEGTVTDPAETQLEYTLPSGLAKYDRTDTA